MKIKILAVLAVVTVVIVSIFMREKKEEPSSLVMMNIEALATGEGGSTAICCGTGSVVCPNEWIQSIILLVIRIMKYCLTFLFLLVILYRVHFRFAERSDVVCFFS